MAAFPEFGPKAEYRLSAHGVTMRVVVQGRGADVVFVPGGDQTAEGYSHPFARLAHGFRCIAYDPRGAGQTTAPAPPWTMADYAVVADLAPLGVFHEIPGLGARVPDSPPPGRRGRKASRHLDNEPGRRPPRLSPPQTMNPMPRHCHPQPGD
ncbi:MAG: alpha/beta fold hydrolase [Candidatus Competibacterales bacterium]